MMLVGNAINCPRCGNQYIAEEFPLHDCLDGKHISAAMAIFGRYYVTFDDKKWYRYFPTTKMQQPNRTPDKDNRTQILVNL